MIRLMALLFTRPEGVSVAEAVERRQLGKPTAWRLLNTLASAGMLCQDAPDQRYRISPLFWVTRASLLRSGASLARAVRAILHEVAVASGSTTALGLPDREQRYSVAYQFALPDKPLSWHMEHQPSSPLHTAAAGKCYLAAQPKPALKRYLQKGLTGMTEMSITSEEQLLRELEDVRRQGYALSRGEISRGVQSLGVPLADATGKTVGGLAIVRVMAGFTTADVRYWVPVLRLAASRISALLVADWHDELVRPHDAARAASRGERIT
jgi:DNA-binding IclR family transcriptional regulator